MTRSHLDRSSSCGAIEMLVMQATPFCNLDCSYCYLPDRGSKRRMSEATIERTFERVFASPFLSDRITVLWHAGEPLVPGVEYYERAFAIAERLRPPGVHVAHNFQTNATLLTQRWAEFFKSRSDTSIGISIDGPAHLNDRYRTARNGAGSFDQVMRGVRVLQHNAIPFHVITVLTRDTLPFAREMFDFCAANGFTRIAFNIEEIEGDHLTSSLQQRNIDTQVRAFFREFIALIEAHGSKIEVREFLGAFAGIANPNAGDYGNPMAQALRVVSVGVDGELSTFSPELLGNRSPRHSSFVFGNVHRNAIADMLDNTNFRAVKAEIDAGLEQCRRSCEYFDICLGGSPVNKLFENGSFNSTETLFCRLSKKAVIDVVLERVEREIGLAS